LLTPCKHWCWLGGNRKFVIVSSESLRFVHPFFNFFYYIILFICIFRIAAEEKNWYGSYAEHVLYSWDQSEFQDACADPQFFSTVSVNLGFQVREVDEAIEVAEAACEKVQDLEEEVEELCIALENSEANLTHATNALETAKVELDNIKQKKHVKANQLTNATKKVEKAEVQLAAATESVLIAKEDYAATPSTELALEKAHAKELVKKAICVAHTVATQKEQEASQASSAVIPTAQTTIPTVQTTPQQMEALKARSKVAELRQKWNWTDENPNVDGAIVTQYTAGSSEKRRSLIDRKFSIVGGSVRWMFGLSLEGAEDDIEYWITRCEDYTQLLDKSSGTAATKASNHLLSREAGRTERRIQSRYIMLRVAECTATKLVESARNSSMIDNPAWIGWVFQLEFFGHLHYAINYDKDLTLRTTENTDVTWHTSNGAKRYLEPDDLCGEKMMVPGPERFVNKLSLRAGDWLIPSKWNQGCFDVLQLCKDTLRVVQVTVAKTHSLKLRYVRHVLQKLAGLLVHISHIKSNSSFSDWV
jgi:hypothetical protein